MCGLLAVRCRLGWRGMGGYGRVLAAALTTLAAVALLASPASAVEAKAPVIERAVTEADGEIHVDANINPEGLATSYEIEVECPSHALCAHTAGDLSDVEEPVTVALAVVDLAFGSYVCTVTASNSSGSTTDTWKVERPIGEGFHPEPGVWTTGDQEEAEHATAEAEAEWQQAKEEEERKRAEEVASELAAEAAALDRRHEEEAKEALAQDAAEHPACVVPSVRGDTLVEAHRALVRAHCRLGRVTEPRRHDRALRITVQAPRSGQRLTNGALVGVVLGAGDRAHHRR
jgi:hypothetical protein